MCLWWASGRISSDLTSTKWYPLHCMLDGGRERGYGSLSSSLIDGRSTHVNPEHINNGLLFQIHGILSNVLGSRDHLVSSSSKDARPPASALGFLGTPLSKLIRKTLSSPLRLFLHPLVHSPPPPSGFHLCSTPGTHFRPWVPLHLMTLGLGNRLQDPSLDPGRHSA